MKEGLYQTREGTQTAAVFYLDIGHRLSSGGGGGWGTVCVSSAPGADSGGRKEVNRSED